VSIAQRVDVPTGCVPNYREFVRHLWRYEDPRHGPCLKPPPVVYRCVIEEADEELDVVCKVREEVLLCYGLDRGVITIERDGSTVAHGVSFNSIEALHLFVVHLAGMAKYRKAARALGDFMMWSLGFRWV
jgi:hypothetical protein